MELGRRCWLEPVAAIGYPPTCVQDRYGGQDGPPKRQDQIRHDPQTAEREPKNFLLHDFILAASRHEKPALTEVIPYS
jgi:hypothetical protein